MIVNSEKSLPELCQLIKRAGCATLAYYQKNNLEVNTKFDDSPLTQADLAANEIIVSGLASLSDIPIISEETRQIPYDERKSWKQFWLVDPLDGTKEFIKGSDEFTVNIALIENGEPILGLVYAPALDQLYYGAMNFGAYYQWGNAEYRKIPFTESSSPASLRVVMSASHGDEKTMTFAKKLGDTFNKPVIAVSKGSSLKICLLATGEADVYPRLGPTSEWDIAAGHAVLRSVGGELCDFETGLPLTYNKISLLNANFIGTNSTIERKKLWIRDCV
ncbi:MAG: 3'(2'),5'-bisphosphate nucleotidase CysQ [Gammaproteobacteria bacterium]|nr:3'(2'),5'-bisphosphate nucleotidase CysQ [Gammaproteobacteria bacterium]